VTGRDVVTPPAAIRRGGSGSAHDARSNGAHDAVGVDPVLAVDLVEVPGLPERRGAEVGGSHVVDPGEEGQRVRVPVEHGDNRRGTVGRKGGLEHPCVAATAPGASFAAVMPTLVEYRVAPLLRRITP
jgi:hypothetical protein